MRIEAPAQAPAPATASAQETAEAGTKAGIKVPKGVIHHKGPRRPEGENMSAQELRNKIVSKHLDNQRPMPKPKSDRPRFPLDDAPDSVKEQALKNPDKVMSDVGLNDPSDPATSEKLKSVLGGKSFGFSDKERGVLEKILG